MPEGKKPDLSLREKEKLKVCLVMEIKSIGKNKDIQEKTKICKIKLKCSWFATADYVVSSRKPVIARACGYARLKNNTKITLLRGWERLIRS